MLDDASVEEALSREIGPAERIQCMAIRQLLRLKSQDQLIAFLTKE